MTAADKYYLKAKENYPYDLDEALEALEYGLSCDPEHPGLLTLQGSIYFHDLHRYDAARQCFELAILSDPMFPDAYYAYIRLALLTDDHKQVVKLVNRALALPGIDKAKLYHLNALLLERQHSFDAAKQMLAEAKMHCTGKKCYEYYEEETERIALKHCDAQDRTTAIRIKLV